MTNKYGNAFVERLNAFRSWYSENMFPGFLSVFTSHCQMSKQHVSSIATGKRNCNLETLEKLEKSMAIMKKRLTSVQ